MLKPKVVAMFFEKALEMNIDVSILRSKAHEFISYDDLLYDSYTNNELLDAREKVNNLMISKNVYYQCAVFAEKLAEIHAQTDSNEFAPKSFDSKENEKKWIENMKFSIEKHSMLSDDYKDESVPLRLAMYLFKQERYLEAAKYFEKENKIEKSVEACAYLSHMYEKGKGFKQNFVEAFKWQLEMLEGYGSELLDILEIDEDIDSLILTKDNGSYYGVLKNKERLFDLLEKMNNKERIEAFTLLDRPEKNVEETLEM